MKMKNDSFFDDFCSLCCVIKSPEEFRKLFELFLTIEERESLSARFLIIKALIEKKMTQREISKHYSVSIAQITRGSNSLKMIDDEFYQFLEKNI